MNRIALPVLLLAGLVLAGCQSSLSGDAYSRDQARREMSVRLGTVESVREVTIEGTKSNIGTATGAAVGGLAGGRGSTAGAIAGAVVGGVAGALIEEGATRRTGLEITIRLDTGNVDCHRAGRRREITCPVSGCVSWAPAATRGSPTI
jgi:outer membrane lipoprotein SlyB